LAVIGAGIAVVLIVALLFTLVLTTRGGTTTVLLGSAEQTATSAQATGTAEGTPPARATGTAGTSQPRATATPRVTATPAPAVDLVSHQMSVDLPVPAVCPSGELALSGGWGADASGLLYSSTRYVHGNESGWALGLLISSATSGAITVSTLCLQRATNAVITERHATTTVDAGASGTVVAACNAGEVPVGGGNANVVSGAIVNADISPDRHGFRVTVANHTTSLMHGDAYVECLSGVTTHLTVTTPMQTTISAQGSGALQISCPPGTLLSGGGMNLLNGSALATEFAPSSATTWRAQALNQSIVPTTLRLSALCLSFS
jgi:hypothetical protein